MPAWTTDVSATTVILSATFVALGGFTKGVVGLGMPLVAVPLLSYLMPVPEAIALMAIPMVATNTYQMVDGGHMSFALRRFWPLLLTLTAGIPVGTILLTELKTPSLNLVLGSVVIMSAVAAFVQGQALITSRQERWAGPAIGFGAGVLGGIAGLWGPPLGAYLVALRLPKDIFIGAVGTSFGIGSISLLISLMAFANFGAAEFLISSLSLLPGFAGLLVGQRIRGWIPQRAFRNVVLITLVVTGVNLVWRALMT
jgi:uncharacterized membrane protein YfcA